MSNYSTSYSINQSGDLYALGDSGIATGQAQYGGSRGTTINAPVNYRKAKIFRGLDSELLFYVKNQDRKPIMLSGMDLHATLVNRETGGAIVKRKLDILDPIAGLCRLVFRAVDINGLDKQVCDLVLTYTNDRGLVLPLYTDLNMRPNLAVEISHDAQQVPLKTQINETWIPNQDYTYGSIMYGPTYYGKSNGLVTLAVYVSGYSGKFFLQGTTAIEPQDDDWFDIELGVQNYYHMFNGETGIEAFNFQSNIMFFRGKWELTGNGTVDKLLIRL